MPLESLRFQLTFRSQELIVQRLNLTPFILRWLFQKSSVPQTVLKNAMDSLNTMKTCNCSFRAFK